MGSAAIPIILIFLLVFLSWRVIFSANKDLIRAKAWEALIRRALPFAVLMVMALSVLFVQASQQQWLLLAWAGFFAVVVILANLYSIPTEERKANKAFRQGNYEEAANQYRTLVDKQPLARNFSFLSAALGASGNYEEALDAATKAIERDPQHGIAYYNRALILRQLNRRGRAIKDLKRAQDADLPRRFRGNVRGLLEEMR